MKKDANILPNLTQKPSDRGRRAFGIFCSPPLYSLVFSNVVSGPNRRPGCSVRILRNVFKLNFGEIQANLVGWHIGRRSRNIIGGYHFS